MRSWVFCRGMNNDKFFSTCLFIEMSKIQGAGAIFEQSRERRYGRRERRRRAGGEEDARVPDVGVRAQLVLGRQDAVPASRALHARRAARAPMHARARRRRFALRREDGAARRCQSCFTHF